MRKITIYRSDFRDSHDDGKSMFYSVLEELSIIEKDDEMINSIEITVDDFEVDSEKI